MPEITLYWVHAYHVHGEQRQSLLFSDQQVAISAFLRLKWVYNKIYIYRPFIAFKSARFGYKDTYQDLVFTEDGIAMDKNNVNKLISNARVNDQQLNCTDDEFYLALGENVNAPWYRRWFTGALPNKPDRILNIVPSSIPWNMCLFFSTNSGTQLTRLHF